VIGSLGPQAKDAYIEKVWAAALKQMSEDFAQKRAALRDAEAKEKEERSLLATRDLKVGGACASKRAKRGRNHFVG
jgi:hypothetical protein